MLKSYVLPSSDFLRENESYIELNILVPAPFGHLICNNFCSDADYALYWCYLGQMCIKSKANLAILNIHRETVSSNGAIWYEFS